MTNGAEVHGSSCHEKNDLAFNRNFTLKGVLVVCWDYKAVFKMK